MTWEDRDTPAQGELLSCPLSQVTQLQPALVSATFPNPLTNFLVEAGEHLGPRWGPGGALGEKARPQGMHFGVFSILCCCLAFGSAGVTETFPFLAPELTH